MTSTTPEKSYCMKCDVLIHVPSGIAYTGHPEEDKFIGSPGVWMGQKKEGLQATLSSDSLILTWKEGKAFGQKRIPYAEIAGVELGKRRETELMSAGAALAGGAVVGLAIGAPLMAGSYFTHLDTLKLRTKDAEHEIFVSQASDWADRIRKQTAGP